MRLNVVDICKFVFNGERVILEFSKNIFLLIIIDLEVKMEEVNDICMEEVKFILRFGNIVESYNEIKDSNFSLDKIVLEV